MKKNYYFCDFFGPDIQFFIPKSLKNKKKFQKNIEKKIKEV